MGTPCMLTSNIMEQVPFFNDSLGDLTALKRNDDLAKLRQVTCKNCPGCSKSCSFFNRKKKCYGCGETFHKGCVPVGHMEKHWVIGTNQRTLDGDYITAKRRNVCRNCRPKKMMKSRVVRA